MKKILLLSPHTDDIELGAGGLLLKLLRNPEITIHWVVFSTAKQSVPDGMESDTLLLEFHQVCERLKLSKDSFEVLDIPVRNFGLHRQEILDHLISIRNRFNPDLVIGPSTFDLHQDHTVIANEMVRAFKNTSSIITYELPWNNSNFRSDLFIGLDEDEISQKIDILKCYTSQIVKNRPYFDEDFVRSWAKYRGIQCSENFAECYSVIRIRDNFSLDKL